MFKCVCLLYQTLSLRLSHMIDKRAAIIELPRAGWCKNHFPHFWSKEVWPPSSPDLNQWTFVLVPFWKQMLVLHPIIHLRHWKTFSREHGTRYHQETLLKAADSFKCRLEHVMQASRRTYWIKLCIIFYYYLGKYTVKYFKFLFTVYRNIAL